MPATVTRSVVEEKKPVDDRRRDGGSRRTRTVETINGHYPRETEHAMDGEEERYMRFQFTF
jgi:hypothetical protein